MNAARDRQRLHAASWPDVLSRFRAAWITTGTSRGENGHPEPDARQQAEGVAATPSAAFRQELQHQCARCARFGVPERNSYPANPDLLELFWPAIQHAHGYEPAVLDNDVETAAQLACEDGEEGDVPYLSDAAMVPDEAATVAPAAVELTVARHLAEPVVGEVGVNDTGWWWDPLEPSLAGEPEFADLRDRAGVLLAQEEARQLDAWAAEEAQRMADERRETADTMTVEQAQAVLDRARELGDHLDSCALDVAHCVTCSEHERDISTFWDLDLPAARERLAPPPP